jgi:hypothetical protein
MPRFSVGGIQAEATMRACTRADQDSGSQSERRVKAYTVSMFGSYSIFM